MLISMLVSSLGTQTVARAVHRHSQTVQVELRALPAVMLRALDGRAYRAVVLAGLFLFVGFGLAENLNNYMNTFRHVRSADGSSTAAPPQRRFSLAHRSTARPNRSEDRRRSPPFP